MRHLLAALLTLTLLTAWPGFAAAHAVLERAQPADGAAVAAPAAVQLWFSRAVEPSFSSVRVVDKQGKDVNTAKSAVNSTDGKLVEVRLPTLAPGSYKVIWRIVALDGHKAKGEYSFTVK